MGNIYIETPEGNLNLKEGFGFGINISIAELLDVSKKNTPYTKTILLDGTKTNNQILGSLFDVNSDFTFFNPNFKLDAKIIVNGTTVINGFLQLLDVKKLNTNDLQGNNIQYSVKISDNVIDFYSAIKDKDLTDLDFSDYDHLLNRTNIEGSWTNTFEDVYSYLTLHKGSNNYVTSDFVPAIFHKAYLQKIFEEAQYSVGGSFMDNVHYSKEIVPFNRQSLVIEEAELTRRSFQAGTTGDVYPTIILDGGGGNGDISGTFNFTSLDNDSTGGNFDNAGVWNTASNTWTADRNGRYNLSGEIGFEVEWNSNGLDAYMYGYNYENNTETNVVINKSVGYNNRLYIFKNGVDVGSFSAQPTTVARSGFLNGKTFDTNNSWTITQDRKVSVNITGLQVNAGDELTFKYEVVGDKFNRLKYTDSLTVGAGNDIPVNFIVSVTNTNLTTKLLNTPLGGVLTDDDNVSLNAVIPKDLKQSDLINDIVSRYNLVIRTDEDNNKKLLIDSSDDYYSSGVSLDWTDKKDYSNQDSIRFLADLQNKEMLFTYKAAEDEINENYTESIDGNDIYGQKKITFDNQFLKGTKKVESIFSPTPLIYSSPNNEMIIPSIKTGTEDTNIRVLYYGGLQSCLNGLNWKLDSIDGGTPTTTTYTTYPYAGHFDNPITPTVDINFGLNSYYYYSELTTSPDHNQYNKYWRNTVNQIAEGKLITSKFHLTEVDISFIRFNLNASIFVKDSYYHVNKIIDYNPATNELTKVELIKIIPTVALPPTDPTDPLPPPPKWDFDLGLNEDGNVSNSNSSTVGGRFNYLGFNSEGSLISGEFNTIDSNSPNNSIVGGSSNRIASGVTNSSIIASSNVTVAESDTVVINGLVIQDGEIKEEIVNVSSQTHNLTGTEDVLLVSSTLTEYSFVEIEDNGGFAAYKLEVFSNISLEVGDTVLVTGSSVASYNGLQVVTAVFLFPFFEHITTDRAYTVAGFSGLMTRDGGVTVVTPDEPLRGYRTEIIAVDRDRSVTIDGNGFNINGNPTFDLLSKYDAADIFFTGSEYIIN